MQDSKADFGRQSRLPNLSSSSLSWAAVLLIADARSWSISETPGSLLPFAFSAQDKSIEDRVLFNSNPLQKLPGQKNASQVQ